MKVFAISSIAVFTVIVIVSRWLPWWVAVLVIPATVLGIIGCGWYRVKRFWVRPFKAGVEAQTLALRGASIQIHDIRLVEPPSHIRAMDDDQEDEDLEDDDDDDDDDDDLESEPLVDPAALEVDRYVSVEMTVVPDPFAVEAARADVDPEPTWDPMWFDLAPLDSGKPSWIDMLTTSATARMVEGLDDTGTILWTRSCASQDEDDDEESEPGIEGPCRIRALFAVTRNLAGRVKLRYRMFETLTNLTLPEPGVTTQPDKTP